MRNREKFLGRSSSFSPNASRSWLTSTKHARRLMTHALTVLLLQDQGMACAYITRAGFGGTGTCTPPPAATAASAPLAKTVSASSFLIRQYDQKASIEHHAHAHTLYISGEAPCKLWMVLSGNCLQALCALMLLLCVRMLLYTCLHATIYAKLWWC